MDLILSLSFLLVLIAGRISIKVNEVKYIIKFSLNPKKDFIEINKTSTKVKEKE